MNELIKIILDKYKDNKDINNKNILEECSVGVINFHFLRMRLKIIVYFIKINLII